MNGKNRNAEKVEKEKNGKLICFLVNNETVYRTWRTFLQAAAGVLVAGLFEYLAGRFTGQSPQKVIPYFIATAVAAGISAVMNRGEKKGTGVSGETDELLETAKKVTTALFPQEIDPNTGPSETENGKGEEAGEKEGGADGENG